MQLTFTDQLAITQTVSKVSLRKGEGIAQWLAYLLPDPAAAGSMWLPDMTFLKQSSKEVGKYNLILNKSNTQIETN